MRIREDECIGCGQCFEICCNDAIEMVKTHGYARARINQDNCTNCGACLTVDCPGEAIEEEGK